MAINTDRELSSPSLLCSTFGLESIIEWLLKGLFYSFIIFNLIARNFAVIHFRVGRSSLADLLSDRFLGVMKTARLRITLFALLSDRSLGAMQTAGLRVHLLV